MRLKRLVLAAASVVVLGGWGSGASAATAVQIDRIYVSRSAPHKVPVGSVSPWSIVLRCESGGASSLLLTGPGDVIFSGTFATGTTPGNSFVQPLAHIGRGFLASVGRGEQGKLTFFLRYRETMAQVDMVLTVAATTPEVCTAMGTTTMFTTTP